MRIQMTQELSGVARLFKIGRDYEWEDADALRLIERGVAIPLVEVPEVQPAKERRAKGGRK
jgi:hypothetical protein